MKYGSIIAISGLFLLDLFMTAVFDVSLFRNGYWKRASYLNVYIDIAVLACMFIYIFIQEMKSRR